MAKQKLDTTARFTPGPWRFRFSGGTASVWTGDGKTKVAGDVPYTYEAGDCDSNARLIEAAPDLFHAAVAMRAALLKYGVQIGDLFGDDADFRAAREAIDEAIRKAVMQPLPKAKPAAKKPTRKRQPA